MEVGSDIGDTGWSPLLWSFVIQVSLQVSKEATQGFTQVGDITFMPPAWEGTWGTAPYTLFLLPTEGSGPAVPHRWSTLLEAGQRGQESVGWGFWRVLLFV